MDTIDRKTKYEIIKEILNRANPLAVYNIIVELWDDDDPYVIEERRTELLDFLKEMNGFWNEHNIDLTDRQNLEVIERTTSNDMLQQHRATLKEIEGISNKNKTNSEILLESQSQYLEELRRLAENDPEKAKEVCAEALIRSGIINDAGELKAPYNGESVNPDDFTRGPKLTKKKNQK